MTRILLLDDDPTFSAVLARSLRRRGHEVASVTDPARALEAATEFDPDAAILDLNLGGVSGLTLIRPLLAIAPACRIVVLTGYASIATAVEAIKHGAVQYFAKPVEVETLLGAFAGVADAVASAPPPGDPLPVDRLEWEHIQRILREHDGNISATARALKMHRRTLQRKLARPPATR
jgi:two-component system response regulator RegA